MTLKKELAPGKIKRLLETCHYFDHLSLQNALVQTSSEVL